MPSLNEIFRERAKYIPEVEKQLRLRGFSYLPVLGEDPIEAVRAYGLDWRHFTIGATDRDGALIPKASKPVIDLTGWGSAWEGTLPLGFSLACEGYEMYLPSLPGYGDSENPPRKYYKKDYFAHAAETLLAFCERREIESAYFIGHSMGGQVVAKLASINPDLVSKLVLLCTSGFDEYGLFSGAGLVYDFSVSGIRVRKDYQKLLERSGEEDYIKPLIDWCGKQKNPFGARRLWQRWHEFKAICQGGILLDLMNIKKVCDFSRSPIRRPEVVYIGGAEDSVFPSRQNLDTLWELGMDIPKLQGAVLAGISHNPTLFQSEITAAAIAHYLEG